MKAKFILIWILIILLAGVAPLMADSEKKQKAQKASEEWLMLLDKGTYDKCWQTASQILKTAISQEELTKGLSSLREITGKVAARRIETQEYTTELPDAPAGEYVITVYKTDFKNHKSVTETVVSNLDKNGIWKVSGYFAN